MNTAKVMLTYRGETLSVYDWSARTGLNSTTLYHRIENGWPPERALTEPCNDIYRGIKEISKNDAEMELNDTPRERLPASLLGLLGNYKKTKFGRFFRNKYRKEFDKWYEEEFLRNHCASKD